MYLLKYNNFYNEMSDSYFFLWVHHVPDECKFLCESFQLMCLKTAFLESHLRDLIISLSQKIKKFDFHPGNFSIAVYKYEKLPTKNQDV